MNLPSFKLERFFAQHEFTAEHLLCVSDCESLSISELLRFEPGANERFMNLGLGYTESPGCPKLRTAIAGLYEEVSPENILVFSGAEEAIYLYMKGFLGPGDHAIVHAPCYQSLSTLAQQNAGKIDHWHADPDNGWQLDLDDLERLIRPETRLIVVNTPHNPTGWLMSADDWRQLHQIAAARNIMVFCDEVYRESEYDVENRLTAGCDMGPHSLSLGVMSKTYGLAGLRIGWIASLNPDVIERLALLKDYTTLCNSAPSEFLAELALRHRQRLVDRNLGLIKENLILLEDFFSHFHQTFEWDRPRAGCIAFPKLLNQDSAEFCDRVLHETGVLLAPASMFDVNSNHFRIGFGRADMKCGLEKLTQHIKKASSGR